jgi:hypothetical protein
MEASVCFFRNWGMTAGDGVVEATWS